MDDRSLIDVPHNEGERLLWYRRTPVTTTGKVMRRNRLCGSKRGLRCIGRRDRTVDGLARHLQTKTAVALKGHGLPTYALGDAGLCR